ncbi:hypothetical protein TcCL_Unassigned00951 [Trypanosoma cruzi]|nr:hypothetical protein TcCL_Unassigned00951 [Trypanosoma cruzi]
MPSVAAAACSVYTASPGGSLLRAEVLCKREDRNHALRRGFSKLLEVRAKQLGALSSPGLRCLEAWRHHVPVHWDRLCCGTVGTATSLRLGSRHTARPSHCPSRTCYDPHCFLHTFCSRASL